MTVLLVVLGVVLFVFGVACLLRTADPDLPEIEHEP